MIDLLLLRDLVATSGSPTSTEIATAADGVFGARADDAVKLGREPRYWPPIVIAYEH